MEAGGLAAECPPGMSGGIGRRGEFAVEQIDRAAGIDAKRQRPAAAREGQRDMADGAVAADGADTARILIDRPGETGAPFPQDYGGAEIGTASGRERVCRCVVNSGVGGA